MSSSNGRHGNGRKRKTAAKTAMVPQPHGGALLAGGVPGNAGGPGVPPSVVRRRARESYYDRIPKLEKIADARTTPARDVIAAIRELGRVGMGGSVSPDDVRERMARTIDVIREELDEETAVRVLLRVRAVWRGDA